MNYSDFQRLLKSSKTFTFEGSVLVITDYYTGKKVNLDLSQLSEDVFEEISLTDEEVEEINEW